MPQEYIALLDSAQRASQSAFDRIDAAMTEQINVRQKLGEFAVNQTQRAAEFGEEQRINDARIDQMKTESYLRAGQLSIEKEKLGLERELAPLRLQSAKLGLESQRYHYTKQKEAEDNKQFNDITDIYDQRIGYDLAKNQSPEMAREYLDYKGQWKARVANGERFDPNEFQKGIDTISGKYKDAQPDTSKPWSAENQYLFENISPGLGKTYGLQHPSVSANRNALAASFYSADDNSASDFISKYGSLYPDQSEIGALMTGRSIYQNNESQIKKSADEIDKIRNKIALLGEDPDPVQKASLEKNLSLYQDVHDKAFATNLKLSSDAAQGKYGIQPATPIKTVEDVAKETEYDEYIKNNPQSVPGSIAGVKNKNEGSDPTGFKINRRLRDVFNAEQKASGAKDWNDSILKGTGFGWFDENRTGEAPDDKTKISIRSTIENNIKAIGDIEKRFTRENISNLLSKIDAEQEIPLSDFAQGILSDAGITHHPANKQTPTDASRFNGSSEENKKIRLSEQDDVVIRFGKLNTNKSKIKKGIDYITNTNTITSPDQIFQGLNKIKNTAEREEVREELYAALLTALLSSAVTAK